jgi:Protein of unknown function (DUF3619)
MNQTSRHQLELLQDRQALRMAARLNAGLDDMPYDIGERLRAARVRAVAARKLPRLAGAVQAQGGGVAALTPDDEGLGWFTRIASLVPLIALVVGLMGIHSGMEDIRAHELAEVDAALLTDDLPPSAYADAGFREFLKTSHGSQP